MNPIGLAGAFILLVLLGACSQHSAPAGNSGSGNLAATAAAEPAAPPKPKPALAGCADALSVEVDRSENAMASWKLVPEARLEPFRARAETVFRGAADSACRDEPKLAKALKPVRRILLQSGSGAADPTFYSDETSPKDALTFQYAFVEAQLEVPGKKAIEEGLKCWADPDRKGCEEMGD